MIFQKSIEISTRGRGFADVAAQVSAAVASCGIRTGVCQVFLHHTSASLILCENADPHVRRDLEAWMARVVPDGDPLFLHTTEGPDDMPAHVRSMLAGASISLPVTNGRADLGTWQGIYLWEHRLEPQRRRLTLTIVGE